MSEPHKLTFIGQPIADQIMGECSCGWRKPVSIYEAATRQDAEDKLERMHADHLADHLFPSN